jgi:hypothetical protein
MSLLQILPALILWVMVGIRLVGLRFGWKPGILPALSIVALGVTLNVDAVYLTLDQYLGGRNLLNLTVHLLMGLGMTMLSSLLLRTAGRPSRYVKGLIGAGVILGLVQVGLFLVSDTRGSAEDFTATFGTIPTVALYQATFFAWFGVIAGYTGLKTFRRDRCGESDAFRIGFDVLSAGCAMGVAAAVLKMILIVTEMLDGSRVSEGILDLVYHVLIALMTLGFAIAFILPSSSRIRAALARRREVARDLDTLRPILQRLATTPEGQRSMDATHICLGARTSATQLYRWLIVIGDVRVLNSRLLAPQEIQIIEEIGNRIERRGSKVPSTASGV